ncbi:MAG: hypothetical protein ACM3SM_04730 [Bacteroidota bacterium]
MIANKAGMIYRGIIEDGSPFYHARLLTDFVRSLQQGMTIVEFNPDYRTVISEIWKNFEVHAPK